MGKRRHEVNGLGLAVGIAAGAFGGLGIGLLVGAVANEIEDARRRQLEQQQRIQHAQGLVLHAVREVARLYGDGTWMPEVVFDAGCHNAWWDGNRICVNTSWAVNALTLSCDTNVCTWNRLVFLIAHEIGHAVDRLRRTGHPWDDEMRADIAAGWALGMLGIHPQDAVDEIITWPVSSTHPGGHQRVDYVFEGYWQATGVALMLRVA